MASAAAAVAGQGLGADPPGTRLDKDSCSSRVIALARSQVAYFTRMRILSRTDTDVTYCLFTKRYSHVWCNSL
jgi:hypothetical protein